MRTFIIFLVSCSLLASVTACRETASPSPSPEQTPSSPVVNVILMIGDGMGPQQVGQAILYRQTRRPDQPRLALEELYQQAVRGDVQTGSYNSLVTDSAAAATAMACGLKTRNRVVGLDAEGRPCETIVDVAERTGRAIGVVTNTDVTDATPAAFLSHVASRDQHGDIARQYIEHAQVDILLGGGAQYFENGTLGGYQRVDREDQLSGLAQLSEPGVIGLFAEDNFPYAQPVDRGESVPALAVLTREALRLLSKAPQGFLLIVEGGLIDKAAHMNDAGTQLRQLLEFDAAVKVAFDYARQSGETLLIVTADHETGGYGFSQHRAASSPSNAEAFQYLERQRASIRYLLEPILEKLAAADEDDGTTYTTEQAARDLKQRVEQWTDYELSEAQAREVMTPPKGPLQPLFDQFEGFWLSSEAVHMARLARLFSAQNASTYATGGHTAVPVPVFAWGPADYSQALGGLIDHTVIATVVRRALEAQ